MAQLARRMTVITVTMAIFALAFSHLVVQTAPPKPAASTGLVASCAPTGLNACRFTF